MLEYLQNPDTGLLEPLAREIRYALENRKLPWCEGHFQSQSLAANTWAFPVTVVTAGDNSLVMGTRFIAPENGIYLLYIGSGNGGNSGNQQAITMYNVDGAITPVNNRLSFDKSASDYNFPTSVVCKKLEKDEYLSHSVFSTVAQPVFSGDSGSYTQRKFTFMCLSRDNDSYGYDLMNAPHLWTPGTEYEFSDGSFGRRTVGTTTANAGETTNVNLWSGGGVDNIISFGGMTAQGGSNVNMLVLPYTSMGSGISCCIYLAVIGSPTGRPSLTLTTPGARTNAPYDIWVRYTKS